MNKSHLIIAAAFLAGVVLAPKVRTLPVLNKLPSV
jgi:hypothetical protein